jgi:hypothetical protein
VALDERADHRLGDFLGGHLKLNDSRSLPKIAPLAAGHFTGS